LDILLIPDPDEIGDQMDQWEEVIEQDKMPKFKFPLEVKDLDLDGIKIEMEEPDLPKPIEKKKPVVFKTIENKNKKSKKGLF